MRAVLKGAGAHWDRATGGASLPRVHRLPLSRSAPQLLEDVLQEALRVGGRPSVVCIHAALQPLKLVSPQRLNARAIAGRQWSDLCWLLGGRCRGRRRLRLTQQRQPTALQQACREGGKQRAGWRASEAAALVRARQQQAVAAATAAGRPRHLAPDSRSSAVWRAPMIRWARPSSSGWLASREEPIESCERGASPTPSYRGAWGASGRAHMRSGSAYWRRNAQMSPPPQA